ncbi:MAG TPA: S-adenosylmethionine:tRNA ribosyltransferase-isomerase [Vicinamibacterales bacterium]
MTPAVAAVQRPTDAKLLVVGPDGDLRSRPRARLADVLRAGDLVIANDAATLPASLSGVHQRTGATIEVRLAGRPSLSETDLGRFSAVVFGPGDFHTPTERRPLPPPMAIGDALTLGPLRAAVTGLLSHPRLISLCFDGSADEIWAGIARHGRPIQYSHLTAPLALWDVWTVIAGPPVAFEPPSAGFVIDWRTVADLRQREIGFATITHAAGISSTGDDELDARLPLDEPYRIPAATATAIERARLTERRIVAIGTTVVRALEHAAAGTGTVVAGEGLATQHISEQTQLQVVNAILTGVHETGTSHFRLLRAFAEESTLIRALQTMEALGFRSHEFGDSMLIERAPVLPGRRWKGSVKRIEVPVQERPDAIP